MTTTTQERCLVVATDLSTGETLFCRRLYMSAEYEFAGSLTDRGRPSKKCITRHQATEFTFADALATWEKIEARFRHVEQKYRWIDDWRVVSASDFPLDIDPWVLNEWAKAGLVHAVQLPDGHVVGHLSQETVSAYVEYRGAEQVK